MTVKPKSGNLKRLFLFNGILFFVVIAIWQYAFTMSVSHSSASNNAEEVINPIVTGALAERLTVFDPPMTVSNFPFKTVFDKDMSLDDLRGQWVVLNFWATWCPPCIVEMPTLQKLQNDMAGQGVKVIAISLDRNMQGQRLRQVMKRYGFGPIAAYYGDWPTIREHITVKALPTTHVILPSGRIIATYEGEYDWASEEVMTFIRSLLTPVQP